MQQQILAVRSRVGGFLSRCSWRRCEHKSAIRVFSSFSQNNNSLNSRSRGGLPRFHSQTLPSSKGEIVRVQGDELWHMAKVLRLGLNDRVELFNGAGGVVEGCIQRVDRTGADVMALEDLKISAPQGIQWHVFAAIGTLKGGRADWLVEKCTVARSKLSLLAAAEATPLLDILSSSSVSTDGVMIIGPEGDFTEEEVELMTKAGATPVGLGLCRLRVETATVALLATAMLWSDAQRLDS